MIHKLTLKGCDDETSIEVDLTEEGLKLVTRLAVQFNQTSEFKCMPRLQIDGKTVGSNRAEES